jgi:hypothetical protein
MVNYNTSQAVRWFESEAETWSRKQKDCMADVAVESLGGDSTALKELRMQARNFQRNRDDYSFDVICPLGECGLVYLVEQGVNYTVTENCPEEINL